MVITILCVCVTVFYYFLLQIIPVQTYIAERNVRATPGNKEALLEQKMESILVTLVVVFSLVGLCFVLMSKKYSSVQEGTKEWGQKPNARKEDKGQVGGEHPFHFLHELKSYIQLCLRNNGPRNWNVRQEHSIFIALIHQGWLVLLSSKFYMFIFFGLVTLSLLWTLSPCLLKMGKNPTF